MKNILLLFQFTQKKIDFLLKASFTLLILFSFKVSNGQAGNALNFDGVDDYVSLPFIITGSYTKEAWVNISSTSSDNNFISGTATAFWAPSFYGSKLSSGHGGGFNDVQDPTSLVAGQWYHVAVTFDAATGLMVLYKDGVEVSNAVLSSGYTETNLNLGAYGNNGTPGFLLNGYLDDVRIWDRALTPAEISIGTGRNNCSLTGDEPGLLAYYNFNQGVAGGNNSAITTLLDSSDKCNAYDGTLENFTLTDPSISNFVASGADITSTCISPYSNIALSGNSVCINNNDNSPSVTDFTDFGTYFGTPIERTFTIQNTGNVSLNIGDITIEGTDAADFTLITSPLSILSPGSSTTFTISYAATTPGTKQAFVNIVNDDPDESPFVFVISGDVLVLPVEITYFNVVKGKNNVKLLWQTASEHYNKGFEIQRSADGISGWEKIGYVAGAGNSSKTNNYSLNDFLPAKGNNYYRLKQFDINNNAKYSEVRLVKFDGSLKPIIIYPTLTTDNLTIEIGDNSLLNTEIIFADLSGKIVKRKLITNLTENISVSSLSKGMYIIKTVNGETEKFVKQ